MRFRSEAFDDFRKRTDYSEIGGAPLLGVRGITVIGHGRSNPNAIKNAIRVAAELVPRSRERKNRTGAFREPPQSPRAAEHCGIATIMSKLAFLFPGTGVAISRHGPGPRRKISGIARRV